MLKEIVLIVSVMLTVTGCNKAPEEEIEYGVIRDGVYSNSYFNMSIKVPRNWVVKSQAEQIEMIDSGAELLAGDYNNFKADIKASAKQTVNLFSFSKYEKGTSGRSNPSIYAAAENMVNSPGIKGGSDYLFEIKKTLVSGQVKYEFPGDIYTKAISGVSFDVMLAVIPVGNTKAKQEFYATKMNNYALYFILTYSKNTEKKQLNDILSSLKFST